MTDSPHIIRATFDDNGLPIGFYPSDVWSEDYPETAVEITTDQYLEFMEFTGSRRFVDGAIVVFDPPPTIADYENAIQNLVDETAREKQFRDGVTLASYIGSTKPKWAAEAMAFVAWRDAVWQYTYQQLEKIQLGLREQPSVADFLTELPVIDWNEQ